MPSKEVVETIYGKHHRYDIVRGAGVFSDPRYFIRSDGKPHRGSFSSLADAVEAARDEG